MDQQTVRFATVTGRYNNQDEIGGTYHPLDLRAGALPNRYSITGSQVSPPGPVIYDKDAFSDPQYEARGFFEPVTQEDCGTHLHPGIMWKASDHPNQIRTPPCQLGEHNPYVYSQLSRLR